MIWVCRWNIYFLFFERIPLRKSLFEASSSEITCLPRKSWVWEFSLRNSEEPVGLNRPNRRFILYWTHDFSLVQECCLKNVFQCWALHADALNCDKPKCQRSKSLHLVVDISIFLVYFGIVLLIQQQNLTNFENFCYCDWSRVRYNKTCYLLSTSSYVLLDGRSLFYSTI